MKNRSGAVVGMRLLLIRDYLRANATKTHAVNIKELLAYLDSCEMPMERKTIYTDLNILTAMFGLHLEYSKKLNGYILNNPPFEPYELRLIVDSIQSSKFITREKAKVLTGKIKTLAGKDTVESLNRESYVADRVRSMNDSVVKDADRIHQAIAQDSKISFRYFHYSPNRSKEKSYSKNGSPYIVSPFALYWNNGNYYLYAYDSDESIFRYFRVDRMENISRPLAEKREGKEKFRKKELTNRRTKVFDMYSGQEYNITIRFRNELASAVIDQFGRDVMMVPVDDEHFQITEPIEISPPFFAWIATFGRRVKILSPEPVVEKMKKFLEQAAQMYRDE